MAAIYGKCCAGVIIENDEGAGGYENGFSTPQTSEWSGINILF